MSALARTAVLITVLIATPLHYAAAQEDAEMPWAIGGAGGAYLLAEPGELEVEVLKRDLNIFGARGTIVRAILAGPDREVLDEVVIPSTGGERDDPPGPVQSAVLRTQVDRPGIYALNLHIVGDRYGLNLEWALVTNAASWVIETSRGHRDERHREPIVMSNAERPADVVFLPRAGEFEIEIEALPVDAEPLTLYDESGAVVAEIPLVAEQSTSIREFLRMPLPDRPEASARFTVPADETRGDAPWRLHIPQANFFLGIDGLTRWGSQDIYRDHNTWSPVPDAWFPFLQHRWLVSPYQRTVYAAQGEPRRMAFLVHNNSPHERTFDLALEFPADAWAAELSAQSVTLAPRSNTEVEVAFEAPADGEERVCHLRVIPRQAPEVTTYATLRVRGGDSPVGEPLDMPHVLDPYAHENRQFGYLPEYAVDNQVYFDLENRGFVAAGSLLHREIEGGEWVTTDLRNAVVRTVPEVEADGWSVRGTKVAFDADNNVYVVGGSGATAGLLRSTDRGETFTAYIIEGREDEPRSWDIENFSGHNTPEGPPPVVRLTRTHIDDEHLPTARRDPRVRWRNTNDVELFVAEENADGDLEFHDPVLLTGAALSAAWHSGTPSMVVSRGSRTHVVWGEATDPEASRDEIPGVPAYVATYDRETREAGEPVFMSFGAPPNDMHNTPSITMDSEGYLHVVVGTHGRPFQYLQSLQPNDAYAGWSEATRTSDDDLRQTYVGLVCDDEDVLHLVFRLSRSGEEHLDGASWLALAHQRKRPGGDWEEAQVLVAPPFSEYSVYYHRLTVDRNGDVFLNYDYWSTMWFYRNDQRGPMAAASTRPGRGWGRSVMTSPDSGDTWRLW